MMTYRFIYLPGAPMRTVLLLLFSGLLATPVAAKNIPIPLAHAEIPGLKGKSLVIARPARIKIGAWTPFGIRDGDPVSTMLDSIEPSLEDPGDIVANQTATALAEQFEMRVLPTPVVGAKKADVRDMMETQTEADFLLDVRSVLWEFRHYRDFKTYSVNYSTIVTLIDVKTKRLLSSMSCNANANTSAGAYQPGLYELLGNNGQLFKDLSGQLGWICVHVLAKEQFGFNPEKMPATPARYIDPLIDYRDRFLSQPEPVR